MNAYSVSVDASASWVEKIEESIQSNQMEVIMSKRKRKEASRDAGLHACYCKRDISCSF